MQRSGSQNTWFLTLFVAFCSVAFGLLSLIVIRLSLFHYSGEPQLNSIPPKRPRGRPSTGNALTPAEKQARYRARQAERSVTVTISRTDLPTLKSLLANVPADLGFPAETIERLAKIVRDADERT